MSNPGALGAIEYEPETVFGEDVTTFATHRIPVRDAVDCSALTHGKVDPGRVQQTRQGGSPYVLMGIGGSFKTKLDLTGHGSTTAGATTMDALETFLGYVFGNAQVVSAAGTTLTGGTAATPTTTASGTFAAGAVVPIGALADARGGGQFHRIATHVTTALTLATAMGAVPVNGDVLGSAVNIFPSEVGTNAGLTGSTHPTPAPGLRFRLLTANLRYECHGCFPTAVALSGLNTGERPTIEVTWQVAWWRTTTATFPSAVASNQYNPAPIAGGTLFVNDVGTATRAVRTYRDFTLTYTLGMVPLMGPGGVNAYQSVVGCRRTVDDIKVSWMEDADAATTTPVLDGFFLSGTAKHLLWTGSTAPGSRIALYLPTLNICDARPVQKVDSNFNRLSITGEANTGPTTTSELTQAAFVLAYA